MNVLLVSYSYPPSIGGLERQSHLLARSLVQRGHRVRVIAARVPGSTRLEILDGVVVTRVSGGHGSRWQRMLTFLAGLSIETLRSGRWADVIQVQQALYPAAVATILAALLRRPSVVRNAGSGPSGAVRLMRSLPLGTVALRLIVRSSAAVALNRQMADEMRSVGFRRIVRILNAVEVPPPATPDDRARSRARLGLSGPTVLFLGRLEPEKSVEVLLRSWPLVRAPASLLVVGDGPCRSDLVALASALGLSPERVRFCGPTAEPATYLCAADVLVLPSAGEGLSNVLLEAMAYGLPVIASDIPGNREVIDQPSLGVLVPWGNVAPLAHAIDELFDDPARRRAIAAAGREHVRSRHSVDAMVSAYERLYGTLTRRGSLA